MHTQLPKYNMHTFMCACRATKVQHAHTFYNEHNTAKQSSPVIADFKSTSTC